LIFGLLGYCAYIHDFINIVKVRTIKNWPKGY
jgi:hypothetical protein